MKRPQIQLEQILLGEAVSHPAEELNDPELETALNDLRASNQEILNQYPPDKMKEAIQTRLKSTFNKETIKNDAKHHSSGKRHTVFNTRVFFTATGGLAAAAAVLLAVFTVFPVGSPGLDTHDPLQGFRLKGTGIALQVFRKSGTSAEILANNTTVSENDVLQIKYLAVRDRWGAILSVDGNGLVTQHYPEVGPQSAPLVTGVEFALGYSYRLDNAPHFERFIFLTADTPFQLAEIKIALSRAALGDTSGAFRLNSILPRGIRSADILFLKREATR